MLLCLVTDRRRLAPGAASLEFARLCLFEQARHAAAAGIDLIQLRERDLSAADLISVASELVRICRGSTTRLVINDRLDVALACGAAGVHLRGDSVPVAAARRLAPPGFLVGRSVHTVAEAVASDGADYLIAGTVFPTVSKDTCFGVEGLSSIIRAAPAPVLAIGGITIGRAGDLARAGAAGIAGIGLFLGAEAERTAQCRAVPLLGMAEALRRFDSRPAAS